MKKWQLGAEMIFRQLKIPILILSFLNSPVGGQEKELKGADVPVAVTRTLSREFPKAVVSKWSKEIENGKTTYEAGISEGSRRRDAVFSEQGSLIATEQDMDVANLPDKIKNAIQTKYPDAALYKAERIESNGKTQYEVQILKGSRKEVLLDFNGKILKEE
jgi:uncharacterized membrane protein YkoI